MFTYLLAPVCVYLAGLLFKRDYPGLPVPTLSPFIMNCPSLSVPTLFLFLTIIFFIIVRDKVTRQCPQTTTFEEKGEPKQIRTEVLLQDLCRPLKEPCWW